MILSSMKRWYVEFYDVYEKNIIYKTQLLVMRKAYLIVLKSSMYLKHSPRHSGPKRLEGRGKTLKPRQQSRTPHHI